MRRHPKASVVGSSLGAKLNRGMGGMVFLAGVLWLLLFAPNAGAASMGLAGYFGNPDTVSSGLGGRFGTVTVGGPAGTMPRGVAVNDLSTADGTGANGHLYVADTQNNRIQQFDADGNFVRAWGTDVVDGVNFPSASGDANEMQAVMVNAATGSFTLSFQGSAPTDPIPAGASAATVESELNALSTIGGLTPTPGSVSVSGGPGSPGGAKPYLVNFKGPPLAGTNVPALVSSNGTLSGGSGGPASKENEAFVSTFVEGGGAGTGFEICEVAANCKAGVSAATGGGMGAPQGVAVNQTTGDVYVSDQGQQRVDQFDAAGNFIRSWGKEVVASGPGDNPAANAVQTLTADSGSGNYKLQFQGETATAEIEVGAGKAAEIQAALRSLPSIGEGTAAANVNVAESSAGVYTLTFVGKLANNPEPNVVVVPGTPAATPLPLLATTTPGSTEFEICTAAATCKRGTSTTAGAFSTTLGNPAVMPGSGHVVVPDLGGKRVSEFTATGAFVRTFGWNVVTAGPSNTVAGQFEVCSASAFDVCAGGAAGSGVGQVGGTLAAAALLGAAVDTAGNIFTAEGNLAGAGANFRIQKFTPSGGSLVPSVFNPGIGGSETLSGTSAANSPGYLGVDPSDNHLYVAKAFPTGAGSPAASSAERRVLEFDTSGTGTLVDTHIVGEGVTSLNGFAVESGADRAFITSGTPRAGVSILAEPEPPVSVVQPTTSVTAHSAVLHGSVNPNGGGSQHTTYRFEYSVDGGATWVKATSADTDIGSGESPVAVEQAVSDLEANKDHLVRIVASKGGPSYPSSPGGAFKTLTDLPAAQTFDAWWNGSNGDLTLRGQVNPQNLPTAYWFEYGPEDCSSNPCASVPVSEDADAGDGGKALLVTQTLSGLDTSTEYHYRVVARSTAGESTGSDRSIGPGPDLGSCANGQLREENDSLALPECRAYELVSNADSKGLGLFALEAISDDGDRVALRSQVLGNPPSLVKQNTSYIAERGGAAWNVSPLSPDPATGRGGAGFVATPLSADLTAGLFPQATTNEQLAGEGQWIIAHSNGSTEPAGPHLAPVLRSGEIGLEGFEPRATTPDFSTIVFQRSLSGGTGGATYLAGVPLVVNSEDLYQLSGTGPSRTLSLVNRDPSGTPISSKCGPAANAISPDGSIVHFSARPSAPASPGGTCDPFPRRLYRRVDATSTVFISGSQCTRTVPTPCSSVDGDDIYEAASTDGELVLFKSPRQLTDSDEDATADLYLYDSTPPVGQPTLVQASAGEVTAGHPQIGSGAQVLDTLDVSADGSRAYFIAKGELASGAIQEANNLFVYQRDASHPGGRIAFIGTLGAGDTSLGGISMPFGDGDGDGHLLLFTTKGRLALEDTDSSSDLYRYDDEAQELTCISCQGNGSFDVSILSRALRTSSNQFQESRAATEDASSIAFSTREALLPEDENGAADAYLWREGSLALVSGATGQVGTSPTAPMISPDGRRVLFMTKAALYPTDGNSSYDAYAATVGGGYPLPVIPVSKCEDGQSCRGAASPPPPASSPATAGANGQGNVVSTRKACKKGKVRRKGRCVKPKPKKAGKQKKRAGHERGGKR